MTKDAEQRSHRAYYEAVNVFDARAEGMLHEGILIAGSRPNFMKFCSINSSMKKDSALIIVSGTP